MATYNGTSGADIFTAPDNQDWIINGLGGADTLTGGVGNDIIAGGKGNDILGGGDGNDQFLVNVGDGTDSFDGGNGYDIIKAIAADVKIGIASLAGIEEISVDGYAGVTISGDAGDNVLDFSNVLLSGIGLIEGGSGHDTIIGNALAANVIDGGTGNDTLIGGAADDIFQVGLGAGQDSFDGGAGLDTITAMANGTSIYWGSVTGVEVISGGTWYNVAIVGSTGDDIMDLRAVTLTNIADVNGGAGNDTIYGTTANDLLLSGGSGDDTIYGGDGNDSLDGGTGHDVLVGGAGHDTFYSSAGADIYIGGAGYDVLYASQDGATIQLDTGILSSINEISANGFYNVTIGAANPMGSVIDLRGMYVADDDFAAINGSNGNDTIHGSLTYDYIYASGGDDSVDGGNGDDDLHGGNGNDTILGSGGYDFLYGDGGNDIMNGGASYDFLWGGAGNDTMIASTGFDEFHGEAGFDTVVAAAGSGTIRIAKIDGVEAVSWDGIKTAKILGSAGNDVMDFSTATFTGISSVLGGSGNDLITGTNGDDVIDGQDGNDTLIGGMGNDTLTGGIGTDTLTGGAGNDIFRNSAQNLDGDTITDFAMGDEIHIVNAKDYTKVVLSYTDDGTGTAGTLHLGGVGGLSGGIDIYMQGSFTTSSFLVQSDGGSGALILL